MDIFQIFNEAGNAFNRVVQQAEEKLLNAERTEYDSEYNERVRKMDVLISFTERIIEETEVMLEPNPAYRFEGKIMDKVDKKSERTTPLENLGSAFESAARAIRELCPSLMDDFVLCGKYETKLGNSSKLFASRANEVYVQKLKKMLDVDLMKYKSTSDLLENLRLDHDSLKIRIKKAITVVGKENLEKEYVVAKEKFDAQLDVAYEFFKDIDKFFEMHKTLLKDFVEAQSAYFMGCHRELEKFKTKLVQQSKSVPITDGLNEEPPKTNETVENGDVKDEEAEEKPEEKAKEEEE